MMSPSLRVAGYDLHRSSSARATGASGQTRKRARGVLLGPRKHALGELLSIAEYACAMLPGLLLGGIGVGFVLPGLASGATSSSSPARSVCDRAVHMEKGAGRRRPAQIAPARSRAAATAA
jgi:hypothetical protein